MSPAFVLVLVVAVVVAIRATNRQDTEVIRYLQRYGYLSDGELTDNGNDTLSFTSIERVKEAIALFQEYYQLPGDGTINNSTLLQMRKPRCGLQDIPHQLQNAGTTTRWRKTHLSWNFQLADATTLRTAAVAFSLWAANSSLTFERKTANPDILISYRGGGSHTYAERVRNTEICGSPFDGPGGVLAHAYYPSNSPNYTSEIHLDNAEPWHIRLDRSPSDKMHLLNTLTHEIGHSLGLPHSSREDSIMFAYTDTNNYPVKLSIEDILSIQYLYGKNTRTVTTQRPPVALPPTSKPDEYVDLCDLQYVDTVLILDHRIFVTYQRYAWSLNIDSRRYDEPLLLSNYMNFLPNNFSLSAAYQRPSGDIVLFVSGMIYVVRYPSFTLMTGWPKKLTDLRFPENTRINAAINSNRGRTYVIFNDENVAEIDECTMTVVKYQSLQSVFPGIPPTVTLAFRYTDGNLYFADKRQFYRFNEFTGTVTTVGKFDLKVLDVECPTDGLLRQLRDLLNRLLGSENAQ